VNGIYGVPEPEEAASPIPPMTFVEAYAQPSTLPLPELIQSVTATETTRHGRPTQSVITERDNRVLAVVDAHRGIKRTEVAELTGLTLYEAYLSLDRLRNRQLVSILRQGSTHLWVSRTDVDPPVIPGQTRIGD
jgi:hypothetical protein